MSTWWYLECLAHDPPISSADEVEQHTHGLPKIRELIALRDQPKVIESALNGGSYFEVHAARFLSVHPKCPIQLKNEYGEVEAVDHD